MTYMYDHIYLVYRFKHKQFTHVCNVSVNSHYHHITIRDIELNRLNFLFIGIYFVELSIFTVF